MKKTISIFFILFITICAVNATERIYNIESFGAIGDGKTLNTKAIQQAIDSCSLNGGKVYIPKGIFVSASLELKDNIVIYVDNQGVLLGSPELGDYPLRPSTGKRAFLYGYNVKNVSFSGSGEINGNSGSRNFYHDDPLNGIQGGLRPFLFSINNLENINFRDLTIRNGAFWNIAMEKCKHVSVDNIKIFSRIVANNDGIDLTDCENVIIANSYIDTGDDGICLKNHSTDGVRFVTITNCITKSESNCIKFGTASVGGFEDITISN